MPVVLLSFTETLDQLASGGLTDKDLAGAIFCYGCGSKWPFEKPEAIIAQHGGYQDEKIAVGHVKKVATALKKAQKEGRVVWRRNKDGDDRDGHQVHNEISAALKKLGLFELNPNLPPVTENSFLKTAIERVDKTRSIRVIA
jgi:hypothetical protein